MDMHLARNVLLINQASCLLTVDQRDALKILGRHVIALIEHRMNLLKIEVTINLLDRSGRMFKVGGWVVNLKTCISNRL